LAGAVDGDTGANCGRRYGHDCHDHPFRTSIVCVASKDCEITVRHVPEDVQRHLWCDGALFRTLVSLLVFLTFGQLPSTVQLKSLLADFRLDVTTTTVALDLQLGLGVTSEVFVAILLRIGLTDHLRLADLVDLVEAAFRITNVNGLFELGIALEGVVLALEHISSTC
jgi:hypothetical protein